MTKRAFPDPARRAASRAGVGDGPQLRDVAVVPGDGGGRRLCAWARVPCRGDRVTGKVVQQKHRAEAHGRVVHEVETVGFGAGEGLFVGEDDALGEVVERAPQPGTRGARRARPSGPVNSSSTNVRVGAWSRTRTPSFFHCSICAAARVYRLSQSLSLGVVMPRSTRTTLCRLRAYSRDCSSGPMTS